MVRTNLLGRWRTSKLSKMYARDRSKIHKCICVLKRRNPYQISVTGRNRLLHVIDGGEEAAIHVLGPCPLYVYDRTIPSRLRRHRSHRRRAVRKALRIGDRVCACTRAGDADEIENGTFAEVRCVEDDLAVRIPEGMGCEEVATTAATMLTTGLPLP